jgi:hypothetical protein
MNLKSKRQTVNKDIKTIPFIKLNIDYILNFKLLRKLK